MARPIKETPILFGEDARKFEARMKNPPQVNREKQEEMKRDYDYIMSIFEDNSTNSEKK
ncbi:hypothetical protein [Bacteroides congonensis]